MRPDLAAWVAERDARIEGWWDALQPDNKDSLLDWVARERGECQFGWDDYHLSVKYADLADNVYASDDIDLAYQLAVEPD